jgi:hypothetical protein
MNGTQLLDVLPVAVYIADTQGRITYYNEWCGSWRLYWLDGRPLRSPLPPPKRRLSGGEESGRLGGRTADHDASPTMTHHR